MTREERRARFNERQRATTAAQNAANPFRTLQGGTPKRTRKPRREVSQPNESGIPDRFGIGDNLGESHD